MRVSLANSHRSFSVAPEQSVLDAALDASLNVPHACKGGNCGACRARLLQGEVHYPHGRPLGLSDAEVAEGLVLLCQARAMGDLSIETFEVRTPEQAVIKRLPARIERAVPLAHDVMGLILRLPVAETFSFEAGQYIDILLPGGRRRSFSIASPPEDSQLLELHVRRAPGGAFTDPLFAVDPQRKLLTIEGPRGHFVYRTRAAMPGAEVPGRAMPGAEVPGRAMPGAEVPGRAMPGNWVPGTAMPGTADGAASAAAADPPMLMIGGGTGIAPLLSMLRHVVLNRIERDIAVYWGVRSERDLYAHAVLEDLVRGAARIRYTAVLSEPSPAWAGRRGWVHEAALGDIGDLSAYEVYAAGPPAMIEAVRRDFGPRGVDPGRLSYDAFDYAPDTLARQRTSAATKS